MARMPLDQSYSLNEEKKYAREAATDLLYDTVVPDIVEKINNAENSTEITRIMTKARLLYFAKLELRKGAKNGKERR